MSQDRGLSLKGPLTRESSGGRSGDVRCKRVCRRLSLGTPDVTPYTLGPPILRREHPSFETVNGWSV